MRLSRLGYVGKRMRKKRRKINQFTCTIIITTTIIIMCCVKSNHQVTGMCSLVVHTLYSRLQREIHRSAYVQLTPSCVYLYCVCTNSIIRFILNIKFHFSARLEIMSPGDKSSDGSNNSQPNQRGNVITTTFVTSDMDCSCSEFDEQGKFYFRSYLEAGI